MKRQYQQVGGGFLLYGQFWILFTITVFLLDDFGYLLQHSKNSIRE